MACHIAHRGHRVDVGDQDDQPHRLTPDLMPPPGGEAPDPLEPGLHAARERHSEDGQQQHAENARCAQDPGGRGKKLHHRAGRGASQAHAVDHPYGQAMMRGGAGGSDDDEQREHCEHGQGAEPHGPAREFKLLAAPVQVLEPEAAPDPPGAPEHRMANTPIAPLLHPATPSPASALAMKAATPGSGIPRSASSRLTRECSAPARYTGVPAGHLRVAGSRARRSGRGPPRQRLNHRDLSASNDHRPRPHSRPQWTAGWSREQG